MECLYCWSDFSSPYFISGVLLKAASVAEWVSWSIGSLLAIAFLAVDGWRAFQRKKHWIPCDSFLLGALTLLLLSLLNIPSALLRFPQDDHDIENCVHEIVCCTSRRMVVLAGRVSLCVVMGCMLPGLARPRSLTLSLWSDMAALIITCSTPILHLFHEIYVLAVYSIYDVYSNDENLATGFAKLGVGVVTTMVLVAIIILILLLICAALASITVHKLVSRKIPLILSHSTPWETPITHSYSQSFWERVEDQVVKSWIVVCTSNPQYIIARSILSSSVALVITVCNGILVFEVV